MTRAQSAWVSHNSTHPTLDRRATQTPNPYRPGTTTRTSMLQRMAISAYFTTDTPVPY